MELAYGGDDITIVLAALLQRSSFPYRELDLAKAQDWIMFDNLKIRICTLEEVSRQSRRRELPLTRHSTW